MSNFELLGVGKSGAGPVAGAPVLVDWDPTVLANMGQNQANSTPVSATGQQVRFLADTGSAGWNIEALTDVATGVEYTESGGLKYLNVTGTGLLKRDDPEGDDGFASIINNSAVFMAVRALAGVDDRLFGLRNLGTGTPIYAPIQTRNAGSDDPSVYMRNDTSVVIGNNSLNLGEGAFGGGLVVYGLIHTGEQITPVVDGVKGTPVDLVSPQGVFTLDQLGLFGLYRANAGSAHFNCEFYGGRIFDGVPTDAQIAALVTEFGARQGRTI